jgi:hypothetical protein
MWDRWWTEQHWGKFSLSMKNTVFWGVAPCGFCKNRHIEGKFRLSHQGEKNRRARNNANSLILFRTDDGGDMFLQKVGSYKNHKASYP